LALPSLSDREFADGLIGALQSAKFTELHGIWNDVQLAYGAEGRQWLGKHDRYFLLTVLMGRVDAFHPWLYARSREVEAEPDGYLDLWAREHYKSTIITFAGIIQEILRDPEITIGILSHTRPVAQKFLDQIKRELERNVTLQRTYPEVLYEKPRKESPQWSIEKGIIVRRLTNPKEPTVFASGLVDGMPTGAHFRLRVYDDVVTKESVTTPEQVAKTTDAWELSDNLGARGPNGEPGRAWHIGTRYHFGDTYNTILERKALKKRIYPATDDGTPNGKPVFLSPEAWADKKLKQGSATLAAQMLQNPAAGGNTLFEASWLRFQDVRPSTLNIYIMVDPASSKKKGSDYTAIPVIGVDASGNLWLVDGMRSKMKLAERWNAIYQLRKRWINEPGVQVVEVGYERYGLDSDLEYFSEQMERTKEEFEVKELSWPKDTGNSKYDRIQRLEPYMRNGRFFLPALLEKESPAQKRMRERGEPHRIYKPVRRKDHEGNIYSLNAVFLNEYMVYPYAANDDFLDGCSRIFDMEMRKPEVVDQRTTEPPVYADGT
jgi:phage terminase large subunit-like protein